MSVTVLQVCKGTTVAPRASFQSWNFRDPTAVLDSAPMAGSQHLQQNRQFIPLPASRAGELAMPPLKRLR